MRIRKLLVVSFTALSAACGEGPLDTQESAGLLAAGPTQIIADAGSYVDTAILVRVIDSQKRGIAGAVVHFRVTSGGGSIDDSIAVSSYEGVARAKGWRLGQGAGLNTLTASIGAPSTVFTARGVDPNAAPLAHYGLSVVGGKPMPYTSPWYDLDAIVVNQGTMDIFDGYFIRSLSWKWLFGDSDNTQRIRGLATVSSNWIDLATLNIRLEVRGDSLYSQNELLPDSYRTALIYVRAAQVAASALEGR